MKINLANNLRKIIIKYTKETIILNNNKISKMKKDK